MGAGVRRQSSIGRSADGSGGARQQRQDDGSRERARRGYRAQSAEDRVAQRSPPSAVLPRTDGGNPAYRGERKQRDPEHGETAHDDRYLESASLEKGAVRDDERGDDERGREDGSHRGEPMPARAGARDRLCLDDIGASDARGVRDEVWRLGSCRGVQRRPCITTLVGIDRLTCLRGVQRRRDITTLIGIHGWWLRT